MNRQFDCLNFSNLSAQDIKKSLNFNIKYFYIALDKLLQSSSFKWDNLQNLFYLPLYNVYHDWNILNHLEATNSNKNYRKLINLFLPKINKIETTINKSLELYNYFKKGALSKNLDSEAKLVIKKQIINFKYNGVNLSNKAKIKLKQINSQIELLQVKFEQNVLDSMAQYSLYVSPQKLSGVPNDLINSMLNTDINDSSYNKCKITLDEKCYQAIMDFCEDRKLRKKIYLAHLLVATNGKYSNDVNIKQLLQLKYAKAKLLGFSNYVSLALKTRMLNTPQQVSNFLQKLATDTKNKALQELNPIQQFAKQEFNIAKLKNYDLSFVLNKLIHNRIKFSEWTLQQYFNSQIVISNTLNLIGNLFKIKIILNAKIPKWHNNVLTYEIYKQNQLIGILYLDLFARKNKQSGAWVASLQDSYKHNNLIKLPYAAVMCNFNSAIPTISFDDINTLFHEIGHALHHLLTKIKHFTISGLNNVEWDAIELPSQLIENLIWNYEVLKKISSHINTGKTLPLSLYNKLLESRKYTLAIKMLNQIEYGILDIQLHNLKPKLIKNYLKHGKSIIKDLAILPNANAEKFLNSFTHIFAGEYAAGYYGYKWSEVMALNILDEFKKLPFHEYTKLAQKFCQEILSQGGFNPMKKNYNNMMKTPPSVNLFLKNYYFN